jgi:ABC-type branched-subunit amino acid transport system ATPase component
VDEGEAVALLGPNGAGKTTVLRAIMGLVKHRRGTIRVGDADVSSLPPSASPEGSPPSPPRAVVFSSISRWKTISFWALCTCGATKTACRTC